MKLLSRTSFRCGMFFPDPSDADPRNPKLLPVGPLFIFNASWPAPECSQGGSIRFNQFCDSIVG